MADIRKGVANVNKKHYGVIAVVALMYCSVAAGAFGIEEMISTCEPEYYLEEYGTGLLSDFYGMLNVLLVMGIVLAIIGGILFLVGKKVDKYIPQPVILSEEDRQEAMSGSAEETW